jgi:hypothetical protein
MLEIKPLHPPVRTERAEAPSFPIIAENETKAVLRQA